MLRHSLTLGLHLLLLGSASAQSSALWGFAGEEWAPNGRLPDYSYAGYRAGEEPLPVLPVVADVTDFGALGDGVTDDVQAFRDAIAYAGTQGGGAVFIPAGTYVIGEILFIETDNVVLRGAGSGAGGTVLYFPKHLAELTAGNSPWPGNNQPWNDGEGGVIWVGDRDNFYEPAMGAQLTWVSSQQSRGDRQLVVGNAAGISAGDFVVLQLTDPGDESLGRHIHNEQANPGNCSWQPQPLRWVVQVESKSGNVLTLKQPLRLDVRSAWTPKLYRYEPVRGVGLEHLWLRCLPHTYPGHLLEDGFNPLTFDGALDCWLKDVTIENADNGPSFTGMTKNCTMTNVAVVGNVQGHHGFSIREGAADNLLEDFYLEPTFNHGVTVDHSPSGNVIRRGSGTNVHLDHHRDGSYENLFSDIDVGGGLYVWSSGGSVCAGPHAGARNTYWNLRGTAWPAPPDPIWVDVQSNLIPGQSTRNSADGAWVEAMQDPRPDDLYGSQLQRRLDQESLTKTTHLVATFEDGGEAPLGHSEGAEPDCVGGSLLVPDTDMARFVVPTAVYDDQEILFETEPGLPRGAKIGVLVRAQSTGVGVYGGTRVFLQGRGGGAAADYVTVRLEDQSGLLQESIELYLDPASRGLDVRILLTGTRVQVFVDELPAVDYTGVARPAGGGYTSFFADRDATNTGGTLGFRRVEILEPGPSAEIHVDADGITWITIHEEDLLSSFDASRFYLYVDDVFQLDFWNLIASCWDAYGVGMESISDDHITFGFRMPMPEGTRLGVLYRNVGEEVFLPWW